MTTDLSLSEPASLMSAAGDQPTAEQVAAKAAADAAVLIATPAEFKSDPAKSEADNQRDKDVFDKKVVDDKAAKEAADKKADEDKAKGEANDTKLTPFKIEEISIPEGMQVDPAVVKDFTAIVNEAGIPRDVAAKLVGLQTGFMKSASERDTANWTKTQDEWKALVNSDPNIGGDKTPAVMGRVAFMRDTYGKDIADLKQVLDFTGAGNHPSFIKWINNISQDLIEGSPLPAGQPNVAAQSIAQRIYDKT